MQHDLYYWTLFSRAGEVSQSLCVVFKAVCSMPKRNLLKMPLRVSCHDMCLLCYHILWFVRFIGLELRLNMKREWFLPEHVLLANSCIIQMCRYPFTVLQRLLLTLVEYFIWLPPSLYFKQKVRLFKLVVWSYPAVFCLSSLRFL